VHRKSLTIIRISGTLNFIFLFLFLFAPLSLKKASEPFFGPDHTISEDVKRTGTVRENSSSGYRCPQLKIDRKVTFASAEKCKKCRDVTNQKRNSLAKYSMFTISNISFSISMLLSLPCYELRLA